MMSKSLGSKRASLGPEFLEYPLPQGAFEVEGETVRAQSISSQSSTQLNVCAVAPTPRGVTVDGVLVATGGRNLLRIYRVGPNGLKDVCALNPAANDRSSARSGKQEVFDLRFSYHISSKSQTNSNKVYLAAARTLDIVIWKIDGSSVSLHRKFEKAHTRSIRRVHWSPLIPDIFATTSQDQRVKFWNVHTGAKFSLTPLQLTSPVDISFSPHNPSMLAVGYDNGQLCVYEGVNFEAKPAHGQTDVDVRPILRWAAHGDDVLSVAWHLKFPDILATGGKDGIIKVWDLSALYRERGETVRASQVQSYMLTQPKTKPISVLHSSGPLTRLAWRPPTNDDRRKPLRTSETLGRDTLSALASHASNRPAFTRIDSHGWDHVWELASMSSTSGVGGVTSAIQLWNIREPRIPIGVIPALLPNKDKPSKGGDLGFTCFSWVDTRVPVEADQLESTSSKQKHGAAEANANAWNFMQPQPEVVGSKQKASKKTGAKVWVSSHTWQHLITTSKAGHVTLHSCAAALQPLAKVPPACVAFSPTGTLAVVHQVHAIRRAARRKLVLHRSEQMLSSELGVFGVGRQGSDSVQLTTPGMLLSRGRSSSAGVRWTEPSLPPVSSFNSLSSSSGVTSSLPPMQEDPVVPLYAKMLSHQLSLPRARKGEKAEELVGSTSCSSDLSSSPSMNTMGSTHTVNSVSSASLSTAPHIKLVASERLRRALTGVDEASRGDDDDSCVLTSAVEETTELLGHYSVEGMRHYFETNHGQPKVTLEEYEALCRQFIGTSVSFIYRKGGGKVAAIDPRPASDIKFQYVRKSGVKLMTITEYLTTFKYKPYFTARPLVFHDTLPCFIIPNKEGRFDFFPIETCYIKRRKALLDDPVISLPASTYPYYMRVLAKEYRCFFDSKATLTDVVSALKFNATVARRVRAHHLASLWISLANLFGLNPSFKLAPEILEVTIETVCELLAERADSGDVQTCVVLLSLLDHIHPACLNTDRWPGVDPRSSSSSTAPLTALIVRSDKQRQRWFSEYVDLLHRFDLPVIANECVMASTPPGDDPSVCAPSSAELAETLKEEDKKEEEEDPDSDNEVSEQDSRLAAVNTRSTSVYTSCYKCNSPVAPNEAPRFCHSCRSPLSKCCFCHEFVLGLYCVCPGCGHGGHLAHMRSWFSMRTECPAGCGHRCSLPEILARAPHHEHPQDSAGMNQDEPKSGV